MALHVDRRLHRFLWGTLSIMKERSIIHVICQVDGVHVGCYRADGSLFDRWEETYVENCRRGIHLLYGWGLMLSVMKRLKVARKDSLFFRWIRPCMEDYAGENPLFVKIDLTLFCWESVRQ